MADTNLRIQLENGGILEYKSDTVTLNKDRLKEFYAIEYKQSKGIELEEVEERKINDLVKSGVGGISITVDKKTVTISPELYELEDLVNAIHTFINTISAKSQKTYQSILIENGINTQLTNQEKDKITRKIDEQFNISK